MKGLEPSTFCMASRRSSQLSYIREGADYSRGLRRAARSCRRSAPSFSRSSGTTSSGSRVAPEHRLREHELAVHVHVEDPVAPGHDLERADHALPLLEDPRRQTGGVRSAPQGTQYSIRTWCRSAMARIDLSSRAVERLVDEAVRELVVLAAHGRVGHAVDRAGRGATRRGRVLERGSSPCTRRASASRRAPSRRRPRARRRRPRPRARGRRRAPSTRRRCSSRRRSPRRARRAPFRPRPRARTRTPPGRGSRASRRR